MLPTEPLVSFPSNFKVSFFPCKTLNSNFNKGVQSPKVLHIWNVLVYKNFIFVSSFDVVFVLN
jgi:hypothetical protein